MRSSRGGEVGGIETERSDEDPIPDGLRPLREDEDAPESMRGFRGLLDFEARAALRAS